MMVARGLSIAAGSVSARLEMFGSPLLFKSLATNSARMHMALADYLIQLRKPGDNPEPIRAEISDRYSNAAPVWYRATKD